MNLHNFNIIKSYLQTFHKLNVQQCFMHSNPTNCLICSDNINIYHGIIYHEQCIEDNCFITGQKLIPVQHIALNILRKDLILQNWIPYLQNQTNQFFKTNLFLIGISSIPPNIINLSASLDNKICRPFKEDYDVIKLYIQLFALNIYIIKKYCTISMNQLQIKNWMVISDNTVNDMYLLGGLGSYISAVIFYTHTEFGGQTEKRMEWDLLSSFKDSNKAKLMRKVVLDVTKKAHNNINMHNWISILNMNAIKRGNPILQRIYNEYGSKLFKFNPILGKSNIFKGTKPLTIDKSGIFRTCHDKTFTICCFKDPFVISEIGHEIFCNGENMKIINLISHGLRFTGKCHDLCIYLLDEYNKHGICYLCDKVKVKTDFNSISDIYLTSDNY
jgi:hypothetical protein